MCPKSDTPTPIMINLNAVRFYKEFNKFTRRKDLTHTKTDFNTIENPTRTPEGASSLRMSTDEEARERDELTSRLGHFGCAVSSVIRLSCDCVSDVSSKARCVVIVVLLLLSMVSRAASASSSIGHVDDKVVSWSLFC